LTDLIELAYKTSRIQMRGGPAWTDSDRYNIVAKTGETSGGVNPDLVPAMVQTLLEDRFKLFVHRGRINFVNMPIVGLVNSLASILHTPVVDKTGMTGHFDFSLDALALSDPKQPVTTDDWPDLVLTAVREQLGFKLEKQKVPLEFTIIDHAEQPSEN
jgi:hypothetical protein